MTRPKSWDEVFAANGYVRVTTSGRVTDKPEPPDNPEGHRAPLQRPRQRRRTRHTHGERRRRGMRVSTCAACRKRIALVDIDKLNGVIGLRRGWVHVSRFGNVKRRATHAPVLLPGDREGDEG